MGKRSSRIDFRGIGHFLAEQLKNYCLIQNWLVGTTIKPQGFNLPETVEFDDSLIERLRLQRV